MSISPVRSNDPWTMKTVHAEGIGSLLRWEGFVECTRSNGAESGDDDNDNLSDKTCEADGMNVEVNSKKGGDAYLNERSVILPRPMLSCDVCVSVHVFCRNE